MRVLIFGSTGMLGHKLIQRLQPYMDVWGTVRRDTADYEGFGLLAEDRCIPNVDASDEISVKRAIVAAQPDVVVNAIGVVKQLPTAHDVVTTLTVNSILPHRLAQLSEASGFRLISVSTDCVFDGLTGLYKELDEPNARDLYGISKRLGEVVSEGCLTIRTSIIGRELGLAHSLVEWFLSNRGGRVKGFSTAIFSGFPTTVLADIIRSLILDHPELQGLYHVSSEPINKLELLNLLNSAYRAGVEIEPSTELKIDRSLDSTRFREATGFAPQPWPVMIDEMAADETPYDRWK